MPIHAHTFIDPIPDWAEHDPGDTVTHAIQVFEDTYILHIKSAQHPCFLCSQHFDTRTGKVAWLNRATLPPDVRDFLDITLSLCERLIHGDEAEHEHL